MDTNLKKSLQNLKNKKLEELQELQNEINALDLLLNKKAKDNSDVVPLELQIPGESEEEKTNRQSYPKSGDRVSKVIHILKTAKRALTSNSISEAMKAKDGSDKFTKSLFYHLQGMVKEGQIAFGKVGGSNMHAFYALPEFLDSKKRLLREYMPDKKDWRNFNEDKMLKLTEKGWALGE